MTIKNINTDISEGFLSLKKSLQIYLKPDFDVSQTKLFLQTHVPKEVIAKSEVLWKTLLNYLMEGAQEQIKSADTQLKNAFFDRDFRKRLHEWIKQPQNKFLLASDAIQYSADPRRKAGLIASGVTFFAGVGITTAVASGTIISILSGIATIILSVLAFRISYNRASPNARLAVEADVEQYLVRSQEDVSVWLKKVAEAFDRDFHEFCSDNGLVLEGKG